MLTYAELFAGAGGLSMGLEAAGFHAVAHAEIEPHARAVLRYRWPDTRLDGDVTKVDGRDYAGVTLLSGGSPCQDLSVAGKRAGLGGARSSLFYEQVRIWNESGAPYLLWENVGGALSSNNGRDFAAVLGALVGASVGVPLVRGKAKWQRAGVASGPTAVAAWRVLDLQHFGPPQRRVRVFVLAARTGGVDPAEVLALGEGVCGHPSPRQQAREGVAGGAAGGVGSIGVNKDSRAEAVLEGVSPLRAGQRQQPAVLVTPIQEVGKRTGVSTTDVRAGIGIGEAGDPMYTLQAAAQHGVLTFAERGRADGRSVEVRADGTVNAIMTPNGGRSGTGAGDAVLAFHHTQDPISGDVSPAIGRQTDGMGVLAYAIGSHAGAADGDQTNRSHAGGGPVGMGISLELSHSLRAGRAQTVCTTGPVTHAPTHDGADASEDGTGRGKPIVARMVPFGEYATDGTASTIKQRDYKDATDLVVGARPRRLTPLECERLMSWPDEWTRYGRKEDGAVYELSDTARYRLCGNGVGSVCVQWIAERLARGVPC